MEKLTTYCCHWVAFALLLALSACNETSDIGGFTDKLPENVRLSGYTNSSITVSWDLVEGATSYTAQLLDSKESDAPIDGYTTSFDSYQFNNLNEIRGYYVRVRANVNFDTGNWVYIMNGGERARIMPKYGFVADDYEEPEPEPDPEPVKELYPNFPEGWEEQVGPDPRKIAFLTVGSNGRVSDIFPTGEWLMTNVHTSNVSSLVHKKGTWGTIFRSNYACYLEMYFDLPDGASKFSFYYGTVTATNAADLEVANNPIVVSVEYSQDSGDTWIQLGDNLLVTTVEEQYFIEYELDIKGPVRFRIGKNDSRARLLVDDIAVYKN